MLANVIHATHSPLINLIQVFSLQCCWLFFYYEKTQWYTLGAEKMKSEEKVKEIESACSESSHGYKEASETLSAFENNYSYARFKVVGQKVGSMANEYTLVAKRNWRKSTFFVRAGFFYKLVIMIAALKIIFFDVS